ncbi:hypothetical protein [Siphonobacter curvatus]|uniref:Uncharacterized protein n=1 Tax=Siphonobacter curvatus TaxID=2094562 RepID=A0A2S7INN9_9BACT|nr:hypothetical protein [Siphonobacter curvatus]PQA59180.1 hypothetical protein C5O19_05855 [Siphonobacter curvatus]
MIFGNNSSELVDILVYNKGEYPLHDLTVSIIDDDIKTIPYDGKKSVAEFAKQHDNYQVNISIGNMAKGSGRIIGQVLANRHQEKTYKLFFSALNGNWTQKLKLAFDKNGHVAYASIVYKTVIKGSKVEYIKLEELQQFEYPKSKNELNWRFN